MICLRSPSLHDSCSRIDGGEDEQPFWLTDEQMDRLWPFFPKSHETSRVDGRRVLSGTIFINRNGLRWCDAPREYGPPKTLYNRWKLWGDMGVFARMMEGLASDGGEEKVVMIDVSSLKAHRTASSLRAKKGGRRPARASDRSHQRWHEHQTPRSHRRQGPPAALLHDRGPGK